MQCQFLRQLKAWPYIRRCSDRVEVVIAPPLSSLEHEIMRVCKTHGDEGVAQGWSLLPVLTDVQQAVEAHPDNLIQAIKKLRILSGMSLTEAKDTIQAELKKRKEMGL